ncbi:hypothetical protein [Tardiphaga sp.]|jgi:hypothetical protein|uniref:hypothetical protein n=1 Tax=Tardiphaga sp. TaxID=1926292 RepID=UPI0019C8D0C2|nr:hypothetical protein [Tardiphaga sp.]MBC7580243.1 hypothetical protein [Tardiphaga sp.]
MADILSILSSGYTTKVPTTSTKYVAVDPALYKGNWSGTYANKKTFEIDVSQISGFRAQVKYSSAGTVKYQQVLIKDGGFRIGDTKFALAGANKATIKNAVTDPVTNSTFLDTAQALRKA